MDDDMVLRVPESALLIVRVAGLSLQVKAFERHLKELEARLQALERVHDEPQPSHAA